MAFLGREGDLHHRVGLEILGLAHQRARGDVAVERVGLTVGAASIDTPLARKSALSRGLDRLVVVADDALAGAGSTRLAAVLAAAVRAIGDVDLVLAGDSSVDVAEGQVPLTTAAQLGWLGLSKVVWASSEIEP